MKLLSALASPEVMAELSAAHRVADPDYDLSPACWPRRPFHHPWAEIVLLCCRAFAPASRDGLGRRPRPSCFSGLPRGTANPPTATAGKSRGALARFPHPKRGLLRFPRPAELLGLVDERVDCLGDFDLHVRQSRHGAQGARQRWLHVLDLVSASLLGLTRQSMRRRSQHGCAGQARA